MFLKQLPVFSHQLRSCRNNASPHTSNFPSNARAIRVKKNLTPAHRVRSSHKATEGCRGIETTGFTQRLGQTLMRWAVLFDHSKGPGEGFSGCLFFPA